jgi:hypothetical protein
MVESEHDTALIRAFITPKRRDRYLGLLATARGRDKLRQRLAHCCRDLDSRFVHELPRGTHTPEQISALLHDRGAPSECVLLSEDDALDGRRMPLTDALAAVVGYGMGTFISCVPGRLAFYEEEGPGVRYILERST